MHATCVILHLSTIFVFGVEYKLLSSSVQFYSASCNFLFFSTLVLKHSLCSPLQLSDQVYTHAKQQIKLETAVVILKPDLLA
jgi:hypothetical protein